MKTEELIEHGNAAYELALRDGQSEIAAHEALVLAIYSVGQADASAETAGLRARVEALAAGWEDYAAKIPGEHLHIERKTLARCARELKAALASGGDEAE
jgi:hypothetical protein